MRYKSSAGWRAMLGLSVAALVTANAVSTALAAPQALKNEVTVMHGQAMGDSKNLAAGTDAAVETKVNKGESPSAATRSLSCGSSKDTDC